MDTHTHRYTFIKTIESQFFQYFYKAVGKSGKSTEVVISKVNFFCSKCSLGIYMCNNLK